MTLFAARLLVLVAVPVAAWSQAFPKGSSATWQGWTMPTTGPSFGARTRSPARTPDFSPSSGSGLKSEPTEGSVPTWKVTRIERILLDAVMTHARTRPLKRGRRQADQSKTTDREPPPQACPVPGAEAAEGPAPSTPIANVE